MWKKIRNRDERFIEFYWRDIFDKEEKYGFSEYNFKYELRR